MKKLTLNILIIFLLFISSYQLTDNEQRIIEAEINQCIYNITNSCGSLYNNPNLNIDYKNNRCIGYCHEFLHTKLQQTMKFFNIPHSDFSKIAGELQERWNNRTELYKLLRFNFTNDYKIETITVNNTLYDLASNISAEIKNYSLNVVTKCFKHNNLITIKRCLIIPLTKGYLATTFSYYSIITAQEVATIVLIIDPQENESYEKIGFMILEGIKNKIDKKKKLRRLNEEEDELYNMIYRLFKSFCGLFW